MIAKVYSAIPVGYDGRIVEVEGDMNRGLPAFNIVGMANKTINEARDRVRSALVNSNFSFPDRKVTVNLAPAELAKDGTHLDFPIALAILTLSGQLLQKNVDNKLFVGELSLDGEIRAVRGIINIVESAKNAGFSEIYLPIENLPQAMLVTGVKLIGVRTLQEAFLCLKGELKLCNIDGDNTAYVVRNTITEEKIIASRHNSGVVKNKNTACSVVFPDKNSHNESVVENTKSEKNRDEPLLDHIRGQSLAKRAMAIAIAGHHNILISGPPGAGKTLLAKAAANLLPELSAKERVAITKIYSLANLTDKIVQKRPFRAPHHTASPISIIGGGNHAAPGEISLAHFGVLFLDEVPEYPRSVLEALRQPLEDKQISISRANQKSTYPADFMLIATMNPCPCGFFGDPDHECVCSSRQIEAYQKRLSGPLFDRIDMNVAVERVKNTDLLKKRDFVLKSVEKSEHFVVKKTILRAVQRQRERYQKSDFYNSSLSSHQVSKLLTLDPRAEQFLSMASEKLKLSARAYFKVIKVAQTIADLDGCDKIGQTQIAEALTYRKR